jgi:hypothetical protein
MEELHTDSINGGHEGQLWARSRARERAYSNRGKIVNRSFGLNISIFFRNFVMPVIMSKSLIAIP